MNQNETIQTLFNWMKMKNKLLNSQNNCLYYSYTNCSNTS